MRVLALLAPGDYLVAALGAGLCALSFAWAWTGAAGEKAVVRRGGVVVAEIDLARSRSVDVVGAIGVTTIAVDAGRVRVARDPGRHQYCVRQGWLSRAGEIAICAPNEISVQVVGGKEPYDSLAY